MSERNSREIQQALAQPFAPEDLEWRLQNTIEDKMRGMAVPYVTNRAIQNGLDEVCGPERSPSCVALPSILKAEASLPSGTAPRTRTLSRSKAVFPTV